MKWLVPIATGLAVLGIAGAIVSYGAIREGAAERKGHAALPAHPSAADRIRVLEIRAAETTYAIRELYKRAFGVYPPSGGAGLELSDNTR